MNPPHPFARARALHEQRSNGADARERATDLRAAGAALERRLRGLVGSGFVR